MNRLMETTLLGLFVISLAALAPAPGFAQKTPVTGAWKVTEIHDPGKAPNTKPLAGLYVFTEKHYSAIRLNGTTPLPDYPNNDVATDAQKVQAFNTVYMNTGAYTISGNNLTTMPQVAKSGFAMVPGRKTEYTFSVSGNTLTLTQKGGPTVKFTRVE